MSGSSATSPLVSVVMPAYNAERHLAQAIESILNQTIQDIELIIVDDSSTDDTPNIIARYMQTDPRVRALRNESNLGPAGSTNRGVAAARAELIAGMDADDISVPSRLSKQVGFLAEHPEVAVVGSYVSHINEANKMLSLSRTGPASISDFHRLRARGEATMVFGGTSLYRKALFEEVGGFDATLRAAADIEFCDRMSDIGPIVAIAEPLLLYRVYRTSNVALRFREGRLTHRWLAARREAKIRDELPPTRAEYAEMERNASQWQRLRIWQDDTSQSLYRRAGMAFGSGQVAKTGLLLLAAGVASPIRVARRLWDQRLSPGARKTWLDS